MICGTPSLIYFGIKSHKIEQWYMEHNRTMTN